MKEQAVGYCKIFAEDDAYVRSGSYADQVMKGACGEGRFELKRSFGDFCRRILIRFSLKGIDADGMNRAQIFLDFESSHLVKNEKNHVLVYGVSNDWSSDTVTYNTAPSFDEDKPICRSVMNATGICLCNVSDYVMERYRAGDEAVSFCICAEVETSSQSSVFSSTCTIESRRPYLLLDVCVEGQSFATTVFADEKENEALWAYAEELYADWYGRYQEILKKGDGETHKIVSDPNDFSVTTEARGGTPTAELRTFKTRLVETLSGYTPATTKEDVYGGNMEGERYEATGRFYTKKIGGRWWMIDPLGYPCYVRGINHINYSYQNGSPYQKEQMLKVYGSKEKWAESATRWVQGRYHMNVACARDDAIEAVEDGLCYIRGVSSVGIYGRRNGLVYKGTPLVLLYNNTIPVFDPAFAEQVDASAKSAVALNADSRRVFGYTSDNEIMFSKSALTQYLSLDPTVSHCVYSYAAAWTWYKNITGEKAPRYEDVEMYSEKLGVDLQELFLGFVYDRYFKLVSTAVKTYDPDALYMGSRALTGSAACEWYLRTAGYWVDAYCVNYYGSWEISEDILENIERWLDKPFFVTEFYAKAMDAESPLGGSYPNRDGAGWVVDTQTQRGEYYQNFTLRLLESRACAGWMFFQYIDNDPHVNPTASNKGMVNCDHNTEVYEDMNRQIALVNENAYNLIKFFDNKNS